MLGFKQFITEAAMAGGISHLEHPSDRTFDGPEATSHAISTLKGVASGKTPITRKIDDKMSFQAIRHSDGKVGVKYKGSGSTYNYSEKDVETQHGHKPYLAAPLKSLVKHIGKVLPKESGEYQGGFMSTPETRKTEGGHISHTPNTVEYHTPENSEEGKKLAKSKVSAVVHTKLEGPERKPSPITSTEGFGSHPAVHLFPHVVSKQQRKISPEDKKTIQGHLDSAEELLKNHDHSHHSGHEPTLRTYINSTVDSGEAPSAAGYAKHLAAHHDKKIASVKTEKAKASKQADKEAALSHVQKNKAAFNRSFGIHHHIQQATNAVARAIGKSDTDGFSTKIGGKKSGGEGYVGGGLKIVDREEFSKANRARTAILKAGKSS